MANPDNPSLASIAGIGNSSLTPISHLRHVPRR